MVGWGVVTVGIILKPREWMRVLGLISGSLEVVVGIPLAYATAVNLGRFSLFALAPIISLILVGILLWPNLWARLTGSAQEKTQFSEADVSTAAAD